MVHSSHEVVTEFSSSSGNTFQRICAQQQWHAVVATERLLDEQISGQVFRVMDRGSEFKVWLNGCSVINPMSRARTAPRLKYFKSEPCQHLWYICTPLAMYRPAKSSECVSYETQAWIHVLLR